MLVPIISSSNKTTVSVMTGYQEYHPVYQSPGVITNTARRAHGNAVLPVAFLLIPKSQLLWFLAFANIMSINTTANKHQWKRPEFQRFVWQMYHMCLACIFELLQPAMTVPEVVHCPDGHFWKAIYSLGPYIADYPEQVWLAGIVQGWCPKYVSTPLSNINSSWFQF